MMVITKRLILTLLKTFPSITTIKNINQVRKMMTLVRCLLEEKVTHLVKTKVMINILKHLQEGEANRLVKSLVKAMTFMTYPHVQHVLKEDVNIAKVCVR